MSSTITHAGDNTHKHTQDGTKKYATKIEPMHCGTHAKKKKNSRDARMPQGRRATQQSSTHGLRRKQPPTQQIFPTSIVTQERQRPSQEDGIEKKTRSQRSNQKARKNEVKKWSSTPCGRCWQWCLVDHHIAPTSAWQDDVTLGGNAQASSGLSILKDEPKNEGYHEDHYF